MQQQSSGARWTALALILALAGCGSDYSGSLDSTARAGDAAGAGSPAGAPGSDPQAFFAEQVQPHLAFCRTCHVPGGVADTDAGRRFLLSTDAAADYARTFASWEALGRGVDTSRILTKASNTDAEPHSGGAPWPVDGAPYLALRALLACWDDPANCDVQAGGGPVAQQAPLLGNPGKHYFVSQQCDGRPDATPIDWSRDPRRLLLPEGGLIDSEAYAVHFNDPFEICHTPALFDNQAQQNARRVAAGQRPIYTAKPYAATCGEWRARVQEGHDFIALSPTDSPRSGGHGNDFGPFSNYTSAIHGGATAQAWNNLWRVWGLPGRPANFDEQVSERYGHSPTPDHLYNPYPLPGEEGALSASFGGSGRLPLGFAQGRDATGKYNGMLGLNCFSCHAGQIGRGEIASRDGLGNAGSYGGNAYGSFMGLPNTNTELGVLIADLINAQQYGIEGYDAPWADAQPLRMPAFGYIPLVNTTRGTNAADTEIEAIVAIRDFDTLDFSHVFAYPLHGSYGDQDPPAWWWLHNKTRYLWFGGHSTDSSRGNMYFGSVNGLSGENVKENEGIFESVHDWSLTVEAPEYPQGYCSGADGAPAPGDAAGCINRPLAEQGAILFHNKDLWASDTNADIPRPKGNGACAGCHGVYSPRFANDERFLPTPQLAGMSGYTVPIEIIGTDPAQAEGWAAEIDGHVSTFWWSYPDAQPGYSLPEEKDPLTEMLDDYAVLDNSSGSNFADHLQRHLDEMGSLDPAGQAVGDLLGSALDPIPGLPLAAQLGRIKGACGFEEKTVGYVTPPLHGVWASAPYFHNGSVPTVWQVLKPEDRPLVWRRQTTVSDVHFNGFEHELSGAAGAYDFERLGWKHDVLACGGGSGSGSGIPYYQCQPAQAVPAELGWVKDTLNGGLLWPTWAVPPPVGEQGLADRMIYNTNLYSKKNRGHEFTQVLTDAERRALIEYLKTL